ncbi:MAG: flagellar basal body-associated FliL family protein [Holosporales bacterium]
MADKPKSETDKKTSEDEVPASKAPPSSSSLKTILMVSVLAATLGGASVFLLMTPQGKQMIGLEKPKPPEKSSKKIPQEKPKEEPRQTGIFINVPDLLINLKSDESKGHFLKLCLTLETKTQKDADYITKVMPKIIDSFQIYLLELRVEDLKGAEGIYMLKQNLLARVNAEVAPCEVSEVLFRDMLVQ